MEAKSRRQDKAVPPLRVNALLFPAPGLHSSPLRAGRRDGCHPDPGLQPASVSGGHRLLTGKSGAQRPGRLRRSRRGRNREQAASDAASAEMASKYSFPLSPSLVCLDADSLLVPEWLLEQPSRLGGYFKHRIADNGPIHDLVPEV